MAVAIDFFQFPDALDVVTFNGVDTPGRAEVGDDWARKNAYDKKHGKGTAGATITLQGRPPAEGTITFYVWGTAQRQQWDADIMPILTKVPRPTQPAAQAASAATTTTTTGPTTLLNGGGSSGVVQSPSTGVSSFTGQPSTSTAATSQPALSKADAIDIYHPLLADIGVSAVVPPEELYVWHHEGNQLWSRKIKFVEFTIPPQTSIAATPTGAPDTNAVPTGSYAGTNPQPSAAAAGSGSASGAAADAQGALGP
jgi:hypothetical protein